VILPVEQKVLKATIYKKEGVDDTKGGRTISSIRRLRENQKRAEKEGSKKALILLVEDSEDMRNYITKILYDKFLVIDAADGIDGFEIARKEIPDLIISDIMMPRMTGIEMANKLKKDENTNHIPLILLTALSSNENKLEGLLTGADDYISKPFNEEILLLKIENLLSNRQRLSEYLVGKYKTETYKSKIPEIKPSEVSIEDPSEKFIQKLVNIIEKHIDQVEFGVNILAQEAGMESSTLYKKMMAIIGISPGEFIKDIRLKRALQLMKEQHLNISEISFMIGYDNPKYFSKNIRANITMMNKSKPEKNSSNVIKRFSVIRRYTSITNDMEIKIITAGFA